MENKITDKETVFDTIDTYFSTFWILAVALYAFVHNYNRPNKKIPDDLEDERLFSIDTDTLKKNIAVELYSNPNSQMIVQRYITDKYNAIKSDLAEWENRYHGYRNLYFPALKSSYLENGTNAKVLFFAQFLYLEENENTQTAGLFYEKTMQELETGYSAIMNLFTDTSTAKNTADTKPAPAPQSKPLFSEKLLNDLESEKLITKEPLKWVGAKSLCAYFVDNYFKNTTNKWEIGKKQFGVGNLAQLKTLYEANQNKENPLHKGKPRNYKTIDKILSENK